MRRDHDPAWRAFEERTVVSMERQFSWGRSSAEPAVETTSERAARWALALFAVAAILLIALLTAPFPLNIAGLAPIAAAVFLLRHDL